MHGFESVLYCRAMFSRPIRIFVVGAGIVIGLIASWNGAQRLGWLPLNPRFTGAETIEFPFLGKVAVRTRVEPVNWVDKTGAHQLPFKFQYAPNGVWVRAEYIGPGEQIPEPSVEDMRELLLLHGQTLVGVADTNPESALLEEIMTKVHERVAFESASRIVVEHLVRVVFSNRPPQPSIAVKVWGVDRAFVTGYDPTLRVRMVFCLPELDGVVDNCL